jgi:hypothetical protein
LAGTDPSGIPSSANGKTKSSKAWYLCWHRSVAMRLLLYHREDKAPLDWHGAFGADGSYQQSNNRGWCQISSRTTRYGQCSGESLISTPFSHLEPNPAEPASDPCPNEKANPAGCTQDRGSVLET